MSVPTLPTVRDHLNALGGCPEWVQRLGEAIQSVMGCDAALAALRARDLSSHDDLALGLELYTRGWLALLDASYASLTPMQRETVSLVLAAMQHQALQKNKPEEPRS